MSQVSKPADWDVFNTPPIEPVQYYSVLKKKREFSQFIKQNDAQMYKNGYSHYCCIVPKHFGFNWSNESEIFILFFDESPHRSFTGFQIKASKDTFIHETNLLLLFLKKSSKAIYFLMSNNFIYVKCNISDAWELFYHLYDQYLRQYIVTVIGTQFFYSIFYSLFVQKEKLLLELLYKGSKVVRISKKSIFYKIHRKRKLSVTDLIYTTLNMPKSKKCAFSCFRFKKVPVKLRESEFLRNVTRRNFLDTSKPSTKDEFQKSVEATVSTNFKLPVDISGSSCYDHSEFLASRNKFNVCSKQIQSSLKRKFKEIESDVNEIVSNHTVKCFNSSDSNMKQSYIGKWVKYKDFKPCKIESYSDFPSIKQIVPWLLRDRSKFDNSANNYALNVHNISIQNEMLTPTPFIRKVNAIETALVIKNIYEINSWSKSDAIDLESTLSENMSLKDDEFSFQTSKNNDNHRSKFVSSEPHIYQLPISNYYAKDFSYSSQTVPSGGTVETCFDNLDDMSFSTAAGKEIHVSNDALLVAHKIMKDFFYEKTQTSVLNEVCMKEDNVSASSFRDIGGYLKNKKAIGKVSAKMSTAQFSNKKGLELNVDPEQVGTLLGAISSNEDNLDFTTAGGKSINVSCTAMLTAQKIMQEVFTDDKKDKKMLHEDYSSLLKNGNYDTSGAFKNVGCSSKDLMSEEISDIDMDGALVEKFFEDIPFDEKELEQVACDDVKNSNVDLEANKSNLLIHKPRKSLGGRRNMRFSEKL